MAGITVQSSLSGASGIAVAIALIRGFARRTSSTVGNFWTDMTRITLYVLLPVCIVATLLLVWQGVPQTLGSYVDATTLEGPRQVLARGPVASQEAIKLLSGDGGGFFNANSAHPFENPTALTGLFEPLLMIPDWSGSDQYVRPDSRRSTAGLDIVRRPNAGRCDVRRPVPGDRSGAVHRGDGGGEAACAGLGRNAADPWNSVRDAAGGHDRDRWRPDVPAAPRAWPVAEQFAMLAGATY